MIFRAKALSTPVGLNVSMALGQPRHRSIEIELKKPLSISVRAKGTDASPKRSVRMTRSLTKSPASDGFPPRASAITSSKSSRLANAFSLSRSSGDALAMFCDTRCRCSWLKRKKISGASVDTRSSLWRTIVRRISAFISEPTRPNINIQGKAPVRIASLFSNSFSGAVDADTWRKLFICPIFSLRTAIGSWFCTTHSPKPTVSATAAMSLLAAASIAALCLSAETSAVSRTR